MRILYGFLIAIVIVAILHFTVASSPTLLLTLCFGACICMFALGIAGRN